MIFGTILADPPWPYERTSRHKKLSGYADSYYETLTADDLCALPVGKLASPNAVLMLWTPIPFLPQALEVIKAWDFKYATGLPWVKVTQNSLTRDVNPDDIKLPYGVGYWFRGSAELLLIGKRRSSFRTNYVGLLSENFSHSRKPDNPYEIVESGTQPFPAPYLELFARRERPGWKQLGDELPGQEGMDIRDSIAQLLDSSDPDLTDIAHVDPAPAPAPEPVAPTPPIDLPKKKPDMRAAAKRGWETRRQREAEQSNEEL